MIQIIPTRDRRAWNGHYPGHIYGDIQESWNIDLFTDPGRLFLAKRSYILGGSDTLTNLGVVSSFMCSNANNVTRTYAATTNGKLFRSTAGGAFEEVTDTGVPTTCYDMAIHENYTLYDRLVVSSWDDADLSILNSANHSNAWIKSWWKGRTITSSTDATPISVRCNSHGFANGDTITISGHLVNIAANGKFVITYVDANNFTLDDSVGSGAGAGGATGTAGYLNQLTTGFSVPPVLDVFNRTLIIGEAQYVHTVDRYDSVEYRVLTIPHYLSIVSVFHTKTRVWLLCKNAKYSEGAVIEWDGYSPNYLNEHKIGAAAALAGCSYNDQPLIFTSRGEFKLFNGSYFDNVLDFPVFEDNEEFSKILGYECISFRGMCNRNNNVYINIKIPAPGTFTRQDSRMKSGVYKLDVAKKTLTHYASLSDGATKDFGQQAVSNVGAIYPYGLNEHGEILFSGTVIKDYLLQQATNYQSVITGISPDFSTVNRGFIRTAKMSSEKISELWSTLWIRFKKFVDSGNKIIIKSRSAEPYQTSTGLPVTASGTWASTTTFTCKVPTGVVVGDEVEVLSGQNSGCLFHILTLSATPDGSATITVTIDEAAPLGTVMGSLFKFDNWKKEATITSVSKLYEDVPISTSGPYLELTIEMRGKFVAIDDLTLSTRNNVEL